MDDPEHQLYDVVICITTARPPSTSAPQQVTDILTEAYSDRIVRLNGWIRDGQLYVGIVFNANADFRRQVDRGPHPKAETAAAYREFWGDRSTLKRFPDGSLLEGVTWGDSPLEEIASFALSRHYDGSARIQFAPIALDPLFELPGHNLGAVAPSDAFEELVIALRSIATTLKITSVSARSPYLRNTAVFPYEPVSGLGTTCSLCPPSIRIIAKLEASPAWPLSLTPLLQFKIALYIEVAKRLAERNISAAAHYEGVTIFLRGFVFELQAFHLNEANDFAGTPHSDRVLLADRTETIHHSYIQGLCNRFSSFSEACRSAVRWVRSKGVPSDLLRQEATELLVAHVYQSQHPPAFAYRGLLEFLSLLASGKSGLTVCIQGATPVGDCPLVIVAPQHCQRSEFTAAVSASLLRFLASAAAQSLASALDCWFSTPDRKCTQMLAIPTSHWRILVWIDPTVRPHPEWGFGAKKRVFGRFEVKTKTPPTLDGLFVDFDPVTEFVREMSRRFGVIMNFWYDELGGPAVGVSFTDDVITAKPMKEENLAFADVEGDGEVAVSIDVIVEQIKVIGGELIKRIQRRG